MDGHDARCADVAASSVAWPSASRQMSAGRRAPYAVRVTWPRLARTALVGVVVVLFVSAQMQIWTTPSAYDDRRPAAECARGCRVHGSAPRGPFLAAAGSPRGRWGPPLVNGASGSELGQPWFAVLLAVYALGAHASTGAAGLGMGAVAGGILAYDIPRLRDGAPIDEVDPGVVHRGRYLGPGSVDAASTARARRVDRAHRSRGA